MSRSGHRSVTLDDIGPREAIVVGRFELERGYWFPRHRHPAHQLAWAPRGTLSVRVGYAGDTYVLPPTLALWLPAGVEHETGAMSPLDLRGIYFHPQRCAVGWQAPTVVAVSPLLRELIEFLVAAEDRARARQLAEALVGDLLEPVSATTVRVPRLEDPRARTVADALAGDPADDRTVQAWGRAVGVSGRTLARVWLAETGLSFGRWRTQLRLQAALPLLAGGLPVATVARRVGFATPSAFVSVFRRALGVTPGRYFAAQQLPSDET